MEDGAHLPGAGDHGVGADPFGRGMHVLAVAAAQSETEYIGKPHGSGVVGRVLVHEGMITVGPASDPLTLGPGDFARYGADRLHVYRSADEDCHGVLLVGYPPA